MSEKTVTVGDTDVEIRETDDGFEAVEVPEGPSTTITFTSAAGSTVVIDATAEFEVVATDESKRNPYVAGFDESAVVDGYANTYPDERLDGDWDRDWYFESADIEL